MSIQNRWQRKRCNSMCLRNLRCLFEYSFPRLSLLSLSPLTRRDIWCRPLPQSRVPSAISSALKPLQLQTPTVPSPLFHLALLRSPFVPTSPLHSFHSFSHFPFSIPRSFLSLSHSLVPCRSPVPFTFAHYSRKSNFVTRAGSIRARIPSSIPGKLHVGRHRRLERRFPLSSALLPSTIPTVLYHILDVHLHPAINPFRVK